MSDESNLGGTFTFPGTSTTVHRVGYGAMQLAGKGVWGMPDDVDGAIAVLRAAVEAGVDHIDTSDFYGPHTTNQLIKRALHPYPENLTIVTKVGFRRPANRSWVPAHSVEELTSAVHDNLRNLGLDALDVVNLRWGGAQGPNDASLEAPFAALAELKRQGLIKHLGVSTVTAKQVAEARAIDDVVCVQNLYNLAHREDDALVDDLAKDGIAYVPYFPLGGFSPLQSSELSDAATALGATPLQVALAWLLRRSPNVLVIAGTSSVDHLRDNLKAADLELTPDALAALDRIGSEKGA